MDNDPPTPTPPSGEPIPPVAPSVLDVSLKGLCPRCGAPTLFNGMLSFAPTCSACGFDFDQFNLGDGPAAFLTLILGTVITGLAVWLQVALSPPWWVHVILWVPLTLAGVIGSLRLAKAALVALEFRNAAHEGRLQ